jgi:hypothetical protein
VLYVEPSINWVILAQGAQAGDADPWMPSRHRTPRPNAWSIDGN